MSMTCNLCNTPLRHAEDTYCKSCVGAVELLLIGERGRDIWEEQCIMYRGSYEGNVNSLMERFIDEHSNKPFKLQIEELLSYLKEEIVLRLKFYKKDDLFIVFLTIKEFIRKK